MRHTPGWLTWPIMAVVLGTGCQRIGRYPLQEGQPTKQEKTGKTLPEDLAWIEPRPTMDIPIFFIADSAKVWEKLPAFWNPFPPPGSGPATCHLGLSPLGAVASIALAGSLQAVKIKVPRGLPDPTPHIPPANPPTLGKWQLGKSIFFEPFIKDRFVNTKCATCHDPRHGFAEDGAINPQALVHTPSLINCVFNRHQFWDGRADYLEQTIVRSLDDENLPPDDRPKKHRWGGLVEYLRKDPEYLGRFQEVFGTRPTQDAVAKALATYLRTILSGDSLFDRAEHECKKRHDKDLSTAHFEAVLDESALKALGRDKKTEAAKDLARGYQLFHGKARCHLCHAPPLFTDFDFHNIGLESDSLLLTGLDDPALGRFAQAPIGVKETRLRGAFRTPTLRALPRTAPYFHNGRYQSLEEVLAYFNHGIDARLNQYLARPLLDPSGLPRHLDLDEDESTALLLFLRALDGQAVDSRVASPPGKKAPAQ